MHDVSPPQTEAELLTRCHALYGWSVAQLLHALNLHPPQRSSQRKGLIGTALELALGAHAGAQSKPDFPDLGIELKTLPIGPQGYPLESTFVTTIALLRAHHETWETSRCYAKLRRVLWFPVEGVTSIPFEERRLGRAWLWSPSLEQVTILKQDWTTFMTLITLGRLNEINATMGTYLQIRPKGANSKALCDHFDESGHQTKTLPRGFYLRASFTGTLK